MQKLHLRYLKHQRHRLMMSRQTTSTLSLDERITALNWAINMLLTAAAAALPDAAAAALPAA